MLLMASPIQSCVVNLIIDFKIIFGHHLPLHVLQIRHLKELLVGEAIVGEEPIQVLRWEVPKVILMLIWQLTVLHGGVIMSVVPTSY